MKRWKVLGLSLLVAAVVAACSSADETTAGDRQETSGTTAPDGGAEAPDGATAEGAGTSTVPAGEPGGGAAPSGGDPSSGGKPAVAGNGGSAPARPGAPRPVVRASQGVTATTIKLGAFLFDWGGLKNVKGFNDGEPRAQAQAVANYINSHGGIAGRKIQLVFAGYGVTSSNQTADEQASCSSFTQDHKVFAVVYPLLQAGILPRCLAQKNTPMISPGGGQEDEESMAALRNFLFYSGSMTVSRIARSYVDGLVAQKFLTKGSKIGLIRPDDAPFKRASDKHLKPRLAAHGLRLTEEAVVQANTSVSDTARQMPNVVLRFQQRGIDRVLFLDNGTIGSLFVTQAQTQRYSPKYGFNSMSNPNFMVNNAPAEALVGSVGVGLQSALDVTTSNEAPITPPMKTCYDIMAAAGQADVDRIGVWVQRMYCDGLFFLKASLEGATDLTPGGLRARVEALGTSYRSAQTFTTQFGPGRYDGGSSVRYFAFVNGCKCFRYTSGPVPAR